MNANSPTGNDNICPTTNERSTIDGIDDVVIVATGGKNNGRTPDGGSDDKFVSDHESGDDPMGD